MYSTTSVTFHVEIWLPDGITNAAELTSGLCGIIDSATTWDWAIAPTRFKAGLTGSFWRETVYLDGMSTDGPVLEILVIDWLLIDFTGDIATGCGKTVVVVLVIACDFIEFDDSWLCW